MHVSAVRLVSCLPLTSALREAMHSALASVDYLPRLRKSIEARDGVHSRHSSQDTPGLAVRNLGATWPGPTPVELPNRNMPAPAFTLAYTSIGCGLTWVRLGLVRLSLRTPRSQAACDRAPVFPGCHSGYFFTCGPLRSTGLLQPSRLVHQKSMSALVRAVGFEPTTTRVQAGNSTRLSYTLNSIGCGLP